MKRKLWALLLTAALLTACLASAAYAAESPAIEVGTAEASAGDTVTLTVVMKNNPGIFAMSMPITYDETRLEDPVYEGVGLTGWTIGTKAQWESSAMSDSNYSGEILKLTFTVKADAPAGFAAVSVDPVTAGNLDEERVAFAVTGGGVEVSAPQSGVIAGDADGDQSVTRLDAALTLRYCVGLCGTLPNMAAADVNGDGYINALDSALMMKLAQILNNI